MFFSTKLNDVQHLTNNEFICKTFTLEKEKKEKIISSGIEENLFTSD